jgi:hypothetical protein
MSAPLTQDDSLYLVFDGRIPVDRRAPGIWGNDPGLLKPDNQQCRVSDFTAASFVYAFHRDFAERECGWGASQFPTARIVNAAGALVARVSYNGRVWPNEDWRPGLVPLLDPYKREAVA